MSRPDTATDPRSIAAARLASSWLLTYPDVELLERLGAIAAVVESLPAAAGEPLGSFLEHVSGTPLLELQAHFVSVFDMRRKACPYLTYWTDGETRNRGQAILRFKHAYTETGFHVSDEELPDHLAVVLEFAAIGDRVTGDALLAEHAGPIRLLRDALQRMDSAYVHVLDAVVATLPEVTPEVQRRMEDLAASGPPVEQVGLEPFGANMNLLEIGARR